MTKQGHTAAPVHIGMTPPKTARCKHVSLFAGTADSAHNPSQQPMQGGPRSHLTHTPPPHPSVPLPHNASVCCQLPAKPRHQRAPPSTKPLHVQQLCLQLGNNIQAHALLLRLTPQVVNEPVLVGHTSHVIPLTLIGPLRV
jgi:hypothetical protein